MIGLDFPGAFPEEIKEELGAKNIFVGMRGKASGSLPIYIPGTVILKSCSGDRDYI